MSQRNASFICESLGSLVNSGHIYPSCWVIFVGCNTGIDKTQLGMLSQVGAFSRLTTVGMGGYTQITRDGTISSLYIRTNASMPDPDHPKIMESDICSKWKDPVYKVLAVPWP
jgi:hypothetical protein